MFDFFNVCIEISKTDPAQHIVIVCPPTLGFLFYSWLSNIPLLGVALTQGYVGGFVPFCSLVLGTTKNSLFYQDSLGLSMKIMPIALQGIPHLSYLMNLLNLIE